MQSPNQCFDPKAEVAGAKSLRRHFKVQRAEEATTITSDLVFIVSSLTDEPQFKSAHFLMEIGIMFFGKYAAFNLTVLQYQIVLCSSLIRRRLIEEGWIECPLDTVELAPLVGENVVRKWAVYQIPSDSLLKKELEEHTELIATQESLLLPEPLEEKLLPPAVSPPTFDGIVFPPVAIAFESKVHTKVLLNVAPASKALEVAQTEALSIV